MSAPARKRGHPRSGRSDLNMRAIVLGALGVIATVLLVAAIGRFLTGVAGPARAGATQTSIERPRRLPSDPLDQRAAFEREKRARLDSYGWVDRERGIAHMPIERAMQLQAADDAATRTP
ncbi:MAG TPA: hypothetical protein VJQ52_16870 [Steroidobacteraceae bacterium]|nr:hypothetical protein [Steroidobacteraceae bacterium]